MPEAPHGLVRLECPDATIARLVVCNEAHRNALTLAMWQQLADLAAALTSDPALRMVVLRGEGTAAFCSGADVSEFASLRHDADSAAAYDRVIARAMRAVMDLPVPVLAQIHGACVGGGVALAAMCDLRFCDPSASFGIPAGKLGIAYLPEWVDRLVHIVGPAAASEIFFTARLFPAEKAVQWKLVSEIVPADGLDRHVGDLSNRIASLAPLSLKAAKSAIRASLDGDGSADGAARHLAKLCDASGDYRRGIAAYGTGDRPTFVGS